MHEFEFYRRDSAKAARLLAQAFVHPDDDRRLTRLKLTNKAPDDLLHLLRWREYDSRHDERYGQSPLSVLERMRIDFRKTNTFHARSCKAIAGAHGVSAWLDWYDPQLTVDEHKELYEDAMADQQGGSTERLQREYNLGYSRK